jgi:predicted protein tyrosine phosphatase
VSFGLLGPPWRPTGRPGVSLIRPGLLVGEYPTPADATWLRDEHGVTAVLCLQDDADLASKGLVLADLAAAYAAARVGFHRVAVPDGDERNLAARLGEIVDLLGALRDAGDCVYVHCNAGLNRAPTVAIAHLHVHDGLDLEAARNLVKARRHCLPYMRVLEAYFTGR